MAETSLSSNPETPQTQAATEAEKPDVSPPAGSADGGQVVKRPKTVVVLRKGDKRSGVVTNVLENRGVHVDIGVGRDGFLPMRQLHHQLRYNQDRLEKAKIADYVHKGQRIDVWILNLDRDKNSILLTRVRPDFKSIHRLQVGDKRLGLVKTVKDYGAFVDIGSDKDGLLPVSRLSQHRVADIHKEIKEGDELEVWVTEVRLPKGQKWQINLSRLSPDIKTINDLQRGTHIMGQVTGFNDRGATIDVQIGEDAFLPLDLIAHHHVDAASEELEIGQELEFFIVSVSPRKRQVVLSRKHLLSPPAEEEISTSIQADDTPPLSAMEMAFMKARQQQNSAPRGKKRRKRSRFNQGSAQDEAYARTLQSGD